VIEKKIADHKRRVTRLNRYVAVVALLWLVTSFALIFLSTSGRAHAAKRNRPNSNTLIEAQHGNYSPFAVTHS
jgi:preprotein translocase subunit SecG